MKNIQLFYSLVMCYSGLLVGAEFQETRLETILGEPGVREALKPYLPLQEFKSLSEVSHGVHEAVEPVIVTAMEKSAIWESHVLNARDLDLGGERSNRDNQTFKDYTIQRIKNFATDNPKSMD